MTTLENDSLVLHLPLELEQRVADALSGAELGADSVRHFQRKIARGCNPDYGTDWARFTYSYFAVNLFRTYWAVRHVLLNVSPRSPIRILDLGCGAGASSAGALLALNAQFLPEKPELIFCGIDNHPKQIQLFQTVFKNWAADLNRNITVNHICADATAFVQSSEASWDLVICSYLLVELERRPRMKLMHAIKKSADDRGASCVIIDKHRGKSVVRYLPSNQVVSVIPKDFEVDLPKISELCPESPPMLCRVTR